MASNPSFAGNLLYGLIMTASGPQLFIKEIPTEEQIQARTVIAEYIPDNYPLDKLKLAFGLFGRVVDFRVKNPQDPNEAGCSRDVLTIKDYWWLPERIVSGRQVIVEYPTEKQADEAIKVFQSKGYYVRSRSDYSVAAEQDSQASDDMDSNLAQWDVNVMNYLKNERRRYIERLLSVKSPRFSPYKSRGDDRFRY